MGINCSMTMDRREPRPRPRDSRRVGGPTRTPLTGEYWSAQGEPPGRSPSPAVTVAVILMGVWLHIDHIIGISDLHAWPTPLRSNLQKGSMIIMARRGQH